jgi:hypothetical protein
MLTRQTHENRGRNICGSTSTTRRPVVVALERGADEQPLWDRFLNFDGGPAARAALLKGSNWTSPGGHPSPAHDCWSPASYREARDPFYAQPHRSFSTDWPEEVALNHPLMRNDCLGERDR